MFYVDGSASRDSTGANCVGFAVVTDSDVVCSSSLRCHLSAQGAELIALTEACKIKEGQSVTIYTDSRYAFGVVHDFGNLLKCRKFLKSDGKPVLNHTLITDLLQAILLPSVIAVCKCSAHTNTIDPISQGNARADAAAKAAAKSAKTLLSYEMAKAPCPDAWVSLAEMQSFATPEERSVWRSCGATWDNVDRICVGPNRNPCLLKHFFPHFAKLTHGLDHVSKGGC